MTPEKSNRAATARERLLEPLQPGEAPEKSPENSPDMRPPRITIEHAARHAGETVEIAGWLYNLRRGGKICFPQVRDGTGMIQCVAVKSALPEPVFEALKDLTQESSLIVRGKIRAEARAP